MAGICKQHLWKYNKSKTVKWFDTTGLKVMNRSQLAHDTAQWPYFVKRCKNHRVSCKLGIYISYGPLKEDSTSSSLINASKVMLAGPSGCTV